MVVVVVVLMLLLHAVVEFLQYSVDMPGISSVKDFAL